MYLLRNVCFDFLYDLYLKWYKTCGKPPGFAPFRTSSGRYSTKKNTIMASYVSDCTNTVKMQNIKMDLKLKKNTVHYVYHNSYYLNCKQTYIAAIHLSFQGYVLVPPMVEYIHPQWIIQKLTNDLYSALRIFPSAGLLYVPLSLRHDPKPSHTQ